MTKHIHVELMAQYAIDALHSETPWEWWEYLRPADTEEWAGLHSAPCWLESTMYRRKAYAPKFLGKLDCSKMTVCQAQDAIKEILLSLEWSQGTLVRNVSVSRACPNLSVDPLLVDIRFNTKGRL